MPRQRTKGDRIQIQLPLEIDADVRSHAEARGESPAAFVENVVASSRSEGWVYPIGTTGVRGEIVGMTVEPPIIIEDPIHEHRKASVNSLGLHVCRCTSVRGNDGIWRQP